jgi:glycosyltransferase involved in cell wall biosynthesis
LKVLVASTFVPFIREGGSRIVNDLCVSLDRRGHQVDTISLPFIPDPLTTPEQLLALRLFDVSDRGDLLIAVRMPSNLLRHPRKVVWLIHDDCRAYDFFGTTHQGVDDTSQAMSLHRPIRKAIDLGLREAKRLFVNSKVTARRMEESIQLHADVLYPPLTEGETFPVGSYGDYVICPSRITPVKRQQLLVHALAHVRSDVRLVLGGRPDAPEHLLALKRAIDQLQVGDRVDLRARWISKHERRDLIAHALACAHVPYDEDCYGDVALEAFAARRPLITCADSGGTLELVEHGRTGFIVEPDPERLAEAMDGLFDDRRLAEALGRAGEERVRVLEISWDNVVEKLLT